MATVNCDDVRVRTILTEHPDTAREKLATSDRAINGLAEPHAASGVTCPRGTCSHGKTTTVSDRAVL